MKTKTAPATKAAKSAPKKTPAKKAVAKKAPVKVATKKAPVLGKSNSKAATPTSPAAKSGKSKDVATPIPASSKQTKASPEASNPVTQNGIQHPKPDSIGGKLWAILDRLRKSLGRVPARFEYRQEAEGAFDVNSVSFNYFKWRKFHGIPKGAAGIYPKRGSFELSVPIVRTPRVKKAANAAAPAKAKKTAKPKPMPTLPTPPVVPPPVRPAGVPAKKAAGGVKLVLKGNGKPDSKGKVKVEIKAPAAKPAKVGKPSPSHSVGSTPKTPAVKPAKPVTAPKGPGASSRLRKLSEAASKEAPPADCVIPSVEDESAA